MGIFRALQYTVRAGYPRRLGLDVRKRLIKLLT